jgi:hypothetical protein
MYDMQVQSPGFWYPVVTPCNRRSTWWPHPQPDGLPDSSSVTSCFITPFQCIEPQLSTQGNRWTWYNCNKNQLSFLPVSSIYIKTPSWVNYGSYSLPGLFGNGLTYVCVELAWKGREGDIEAGMFSLAIQKLVLASMKCVPPPPPHTFGRLFWRYFLGLPEEMQVSKRNC